jgi:dTDP-4-amino-4,6-dideoxygalactose transaminase
LHQAVYREQIAPGETSKQNCPKGGQAMSVTMNPKSSAPVPLHGEARAFEERFPFMRPTLPDLKDVIEEYQSTYQNGLLTNSGLVARLEAAVAERLGAKHCVAVSSCTSGLMMVLRALGLYGEVIVPSFTFFATGHAILWNGLTPVFANSELDTWNVSPSDIERKITEKTSAILAVHLYGNPCDIPALESLAQRHGLKLIFDAAHAFGSAYRGRPIGSFGDAEVFSLSPTKLLVAGEGGLVTTGDAKLAAAVRAMRNYGDIGAYNPDWLGLNARMTEFNAALALRCLPLIDTKVRRRNSIAQTYTEILSSLPGVRFQKTHPQDTNTYKDYSIHITPEVLGMTRDELANALLNQNIETKKYFYPPLHQQSLYTTFHEPARNDLSQTEFLADGILSLPIYESLPDETVIAVAETLKRIVDSRRDGQAPTAKPTSRRFAAKSSRRAAAGG